MDLPRLLQSESNSAALVGSKVSSMVLMIVVTLFGGIIPVFLKRWNMARTMDLCNALAGGAFLGLGLFHILPDAVEDVAEGGLFITIGANTYNTAYVFVTLGYVIILFFEFVIYDPAPGSCVDHCGAPVKAQDLKGVQEYEDVWRPAKPRVPPLPEPVSGAPNGDSSNAPPTEMPVVKRVSRACSDVADCLDKSDSCLEVKEDLRNVQSRSTVNISATYVASSESEIPVTHKVRDLFSSGAFFLMLALFVHGIFEGIVVGTRLELIPLWTTIAVILGHKWAESFALVTSLSSSHLSFRLCLALLLTFTLASPIGVAIGMGLTDTGSTVSGVFNSLGAGTIFYVASEITLGVFSKGGPLRLMKFVMYLLGCGIVFGLTMIELAFE